MAKILMVTKSINAVLAITSLHQIGRRPEWGKLVGRASDHIRHALDAAKQASCTMILIIIQIIVVAIKSVTILSLFGKTPLSNHRLCQGCLANMILSVCAIRCIS